MHAEADDLLTPSLTDESDDIRWVPVEDVSDLNLHPRFAPRWPDARNAVLGDGRSDAAAGRTTPRGAGFTRPAHGPGAADRSGDGEDSGSVSAGLVAVLGGASSVGLVVSAALGGVAWFGTVLAVGAGVVALAAAVAVLAALPRAIRALVALHRGWCAPRWCSDSPSRWSW